MPQLLPTYHEIRGVVGSQRGAYFHWLVSTSLQYLPTNLNKSVVDLIYVHRLVEEALKPRTMGNLRCSVRLFLQMAAPSS